MYPVLSFHLPAGPSLSDQDVIGAYIKWVEDSPHHSFPSAPGLFERISFEETFTLQTAMLVFQCLTVKDVRYISVQLDRPDEENGFLWRAECIFAREKPEGACGVFHIRLSRKPLSDDRSSRQYVETRIPYIAKLLRRENMITGETAIGDTYSIKQPERFPLVICAARSVQPPDELSAVRYLKNRLGPVAQVVEMGESGLSPLLPDGVTCGTNDILVLYPAAGVQAVYRDAMPDKGTQDGVRQIVSDVMHWVSGLQDSSTLRWSEICPPQELGPYCMMNRRMAEYLRNQRRQHGLSQQQLAAQVKATSLIISRLETVRMQRVPRDLLNKIERALSLPENAIACLQDTPTDLAPTALLTSQNDNPDILDTAVETPLQKTIYCRHCGRHLYQDSQFCSNCGTKVLD